MQTHLVDKRATAKPVEDARNVRTWCGIEIYPSRASLTRGPVTCQRCQLAFQKVLDALPNVGEDHGA